MRPQSTHRVAMATFWRTFHHHGVKSAQPGEDGGWCTPPPLTLSTITSKVVVYALAERADTYAPPIYFLLMFSVEETFCIVAIPLRPWTALSPILCTWKLPRFAVLWFCPCSRLQANIYLLEECRGKKERGGSHCRCVSWRWGGGGGGIIRLPFILFLAINSMKINGLLKDS